MARAALGPSLPSDALVASIIADVRRLRGMARRALPKVAPSARAALDDALRAAGLEVTRSAVRVRADEQLAALLASDVAVSEKGLAARLACVTGPEAKALVATFVRDARARRIERPDGPALALPTESTVDGEHVARLAQELERALKWVKRAARAPRRAGTPLLERDVAELLARLGAGTSPGDRTEAKAATATSAATSLLDRVTKIAVQLATQHNGLASVPLLVRSLDASTAAVHAALLEGYARGWFELQPESSMGRLGADELALCLPGPEGTRLSWVRPLARARAASTKDGTP